MSITQDHNVGGGNRNRTKVATRVDASIYMMADEQHQQHQQQRQHQHQQHQEQQKLSKDSTGSAAIISPTTPPRKLSNIHEMRNQDYVSRLLAATPPYLYSAPVGPNNFFFSDMLRSLVQARNNESARNLQLQQQTMLARRPRKRSWSQHRPYYDQMRERKETEEKQQQQQQQQQQQLSGNKFTSSPEKPLELTNKSFFSLPPKYSKIENATAAKDCSTAVPSKLALDGVGVARKSPLNSSAEFEQTNSAAPTAPISNSGGGAVDSALQDTPPAASLPPQDLVLPPPPPIWYPPLYPPYGGIDPLHFFIDLRVSGHIYDRKKENISPLALSTENRENGNESSTTTTTENSNSTTAGSNITALIGPNKQRHGSAFTVPVPRAANNDATAKAAASDAINLTNKFENYAKYYDLGETKENHPLAKSYMLQHLPRLYSQFAARGDLMDGAANILCSPSSMAAGGGSSTQLASIDLLDSKSEPDCDAESLDERGSVDNCADGAINAGGKRERDIDVEIIDSIKYRTDGDSSRCSSTDEASVTQID